MRKGLGSVLVVVAATVVWLTMGVARADADTGVHFADPRAATLYPGPGTSGPWQVLVFNGSQREAVVTLVASPDGILDIPDPIHAIPAGEIDEFTVKEGRMLGTAELTATSSDGSIDHREVTVAGPSDGVPLPATLSFSGIHAAPGSSLVLSGSVAVPGAATGGPAVQVGALTSPAGRSGDVVLSGGRLRLEGIHGAGEYTGSAALPDGREVKIDARVRDAVGVPLLVLVLGLLLVGYLDRFNKRDKPRDVLRIELERLRLKASSEQSDALAQLSTLPAVVRPAGVHRITSAVRDTKLLLDRLVDAALLEWDSALDDAVRAPWAEDGPKLAALNALVDSLAGVHADVVKLSQAFAAVLLLVGDGTVDAQAPTRVAFLDATRPQDITAEADFTRLKEDIAAALLSVKRFQQLLGRLQAIETQTADSDIRTKAVHLASQLCGGGDMDAIDHDVAELAAAALKAASSIPDHHLVEIAVTALVGNGGSVSAGAPSPPAAGVTAAGAPSAVGTGAGAGAGAGSDALHRPSRAAGQKVNRRRSFVVMAAVASVVVVVGLVSMVSGGSNRSKFVTSTTFPTIPTSPTSVPTSTSTTVHPPFTGPEELFDLPVGPSPGLPHPLSATVGIVELGALGVVAPLALGGLLLGLAFLVVRRHRKHHSENALAQVDAKVLAARLRADQRRFDVLSGLIVILTGLSLLYFTNPTFGSLGDYVGLLLWGSGVGEGVQFARRIIPVLPT